MDSNEILTSLTKIFKDVLDNDEVDLDFETTADKVEGWDSLTHVQLVVAIERSFKIRFTAKEIQSWQNVGEMCNSIIQKVK